MLTSLIALVIGYCLDLLLGEPRHITHPVILIGRLISFCEKLFRKLLPKTAMGEKIAGGLIWLTVAAVSTAIPGAMLFGAYRLHRIAGILLESVFCWLILATKSLRQESMKVYDALETGDLNASRYAVSMIVGRDTESLDDAGVTRAAVETVAENTSDGIIAPMLFMAIGGGALGFFYKAVNTMDSMLGYTDPPYTNIGFVPAKLDDVANYIPARLSALLMLAAGGLLGMDAGNGWRIFKRDRYNHASPNSAQTESVCAGLLGVQLAGDAWYHGVLHKKKFIGDANREITHGDIPGVCRLLYMTSLVSLLVFGGIKLLIIVL